MKLTVLSVAYPLAPVSTGTSGGAEQVLAMLDSALVRAGHRSMVIACEGSNVDGTLLATARAQGRLDEPAIRRARALHQAAIEKALGEHPVDVVHMHGLDFREYLPPRGVPVLVTLHVPRTWYPPDTFPVSRPQTYFHCVSKAQALSWPPDSGFLPEIENGIDVEWFRPGRRTRAYAVALGRIAPEKGFHIALDAATRARVPLMLAGEVFRYDEHQRYFEREIEPRLHGTRHRYLGAVGLAGKRRLLAGARCLLAPSLAPETSSLSAMEALASGTPVIAFPAGALAEIVEHGRTGFLVGNETEMAEAIAAAARIDPGECRRAACERFNSARTIRSYFDLYERLVSLTKCKTA